MHIEELQESNTTLTEQMDVFKGNNMDSLCTVIDCENMEARLKQTLSAVDKKKVCLTLPCTRTPFYVRTYSCSYLQSRLMAQEMDKQKESRLCVICQVCFVFK